MEAVGTPRFVGRLTQLLADEAVRRHVRALAGRRIAPPASLGLRAPATGRLAVAAAGALGRLRTMAADGARAAARRLARPDAPPSTPARVLLAELETLDPARRDSTAVQLAVLWGWFTDAFGGPADFAAASASEQDAYLARLDLAVERSGGLKNTDLARFYFSSALFARYLRALRANDTGADALAISDRVVAMVERGRRLEKPS